MAADVVHRAVHHKIPEDPPLLPVQLKGAGPGGGGFKLSRRQLQRAGVALLCLTLLFVGWGWVRHLRVLSRHDLSSCPTRMAALGLDLSAASLSGGDAHFATGGPSNADIWQHALERQALYADMSTDLTRNGLRLGVTTQQLRQDQLFQRVAASGWRRAHVKPILQHLKVPVRSIVLPLLDDEAAVQLKSSVQRALQPLLSDDSVFFQDESIMHATLWHASTHMAPVPATPEQVALEVAAVAQVASAACPVHAVLDRVVITSSGNIIACWQVLPGSSEPTSIRAALRAALPHAPPPDKQTIFTPAILHTTIARLLAPARHPPAGHEEGQPWDVVWLESALVDVMGDVSDELCGLSTTFAEMWFAEEHDVLALGLNGHWTKRASHLRCRPPRQHSHPRLPHHAPHHDDPRLRAHAGQGAGAAGAAGAAHQAGPGAAAGKQGHAAG